MTLRGIQETARMYIGGKRVESVSGNRYDVINPSTGQSITSVPVGNEEDVHSAFLAAEQAFQSWKRVPPEERANLVRKLAMVLADSGNELAMIDSINAGHPIRAMRTDVEIAVKDLNFFAGLYPELKGETVPGPYGHVLNYTLREPFGVVGRIVPFNHPLMFAAQALAAPLVAGNTVILKPASITPLSALRLAEEVDKIFPPGVINVVTGPGAQVGAAIAKHPGIRRIALTGSVETGIEIARLGAESLKYITLELGGKNPIIVFPDVDLESAVRAVMRGMNFTWTAGQSCQSTSRCFVHASMYDEFTQKVVSTARAIKIGLPMREETEMGCLSSQSQLSRVESFVKVGLSEGAALLSGGKRPSDPELSHGYFFEPTVFGNVNSASRLAQEEIFGPVLSVIAWKEYQDMVNQANSVKYGLTATILTRNISTAHKLAFDLEAGYIWINGPTTTRGVPFGGYKMSGVGRQGGLDELLSYTQIKSVQVSL